MKQLYGAGALFCMLLQGCTGVEMMAALSGGWTSYQMKEKYDDYEKKQKEKTPQAQEYAVKKGSPPVPVSVTRALEKEIANEAEQLGFRCHPLQYEDCGRFVDRVKKTPDLRRLIEKVHLVKKMYLEKRSRLGNGYLDLGTEDSDTTLIRYLETSLLR